MSKKAVLPKKTSALKRRGKIDKRPVTLTVNTSKPGRTFDGIGGNFRLQNAKLDPQVIDYNLNHLRVVWARLELPWRSWQPNEHTDPVQTAENGTLHPKVKAAMKMAQRLSRKDIPIIL